MNNKLIKFLSLIIILFSSQSSIAGGIDIFTTTQIAKVNGIELSCSSNFEAPYDNLYAYESVWNWLLFGGYWSTVPVKIGEKYTGEFRYTGLNCIATRGIAIKTSFYINNQGQLTVTNSNVNLDVSIQDYKDTYETAKLLFTISKLAYDINKIGLVATAISKLSVASLQEAAIFSVIAKLASDSVFIYIEQNAIKKEISNFMNNEAAYTTKEIAERIVADINQLEETYKYVIIMPAINHILL